MTIQETRKQWTKEKLSLLKQQQIDQHNYETAACIRDFNDLIHGIPKQAEKTND